MSPPGLTNAKRGVNFHSMDNKTNGHLPLAGFYLLERTRPGLAKLDDLNGSIVAILNGLGVPAEKLRARRIAVAVGSRGIASLQEIVSAVCGWLKSQGAQPFVFPAMGSHGGGTAEGQRKILEGYGITESALGVEIRSSMEAVKVGTTPEGFNAYMDRNAWESDGVVVVNRIKPHTDFSGKVESGVLKMITIGMGKLEGASEGHRRSWRYGFETTIRSVSAKVLGTGKILFGLAAVENELHQIAAVRAALPEGLVEQEETTLKLARTLVPRIPFAEFQMLVVDEMGKNISGTGMDTKVIGRGVELPPGEAPAIGMIYVRDLTAESGGNAVGMGSADVIHDRLFRKIDFQKTYLNALTALSPRGGRLPIHLPSDRQAFDLTLGHLGSPEPAEQRIVWIRNTLSLGKIAVSASLAGEAKALRSWALLEGTHSAEFDAAGNTPSIIG
ncbi:MAG: lactate racemase domain-containing protein [Terriglobia bacterium]|jgi:acyl-CoA synthetase (AMP-forming)/AMP-acid ligase II